MYYVVMILPSKFLHVIYSCWLEFMLLVGDSLREPIETNRKFIVQTVVKFNLGCKLKSSNNLRALVLFNLLKIRKLPTSLRKPAISFIVLGTSERG